MRNVRISWDLPTTREQGGPLDVSEINYVEVELSADGGANFSPVDQVSPPATDIQINDLPFGDTYVVRLRVLDQSLRASADVDTPFAVSDDSAPGVVQNVQVTLL